MINFPGIISPPFRTIIVLVKSLLRPTNPLRPTSIRPTSIRPPPPPVGLSRMSIRGMVSSSWRSELKTLHQNLLFLRVYSSGVFLLTYNGI